MSTENLYELASPIRRERETLLAEWRHEVRQLAVAHDLDVPTLNDHIPDLLEELADELEAHTDESMVGELKKNSVVGAHGGRVSVESEPGRGSTFRFTIP